MQSNVSSLDDNHYLHYDGLANTFIVINYAESVGTLNFCQYNVNFAR